MLFRSGKTIELVGRQPDLLGQWAQALYFANGNRWSAELQGLVDEALAQDPNEATSLGLVGIAAFEDSRFQDAVDAWTQLLKGIDPQDQSYQAIQSGIERARTALGSSPQPQVSSTAPAQTPATDTADAGDYQITIEIAISDELAAQVAATDTVFVFARAAGGAPMPLAAKRLTVAELPARIVLTDADSLMPNLKLSSVGSIELKASISSAGDAMQAQWKSDAVAVDATDKEAKSTLLINQKN